VISDTKDLARALWGVALTWGVIAVVLGVLMVIHPGNFAQVGAALFGIYLAVSGVAQVVSAFALGGSAGNRVLWFISGALSIVLAVLVFRYFDQGYGVWLLGIWIGIGFVFQGISEVALAAGDRDLPGRGWQILSGLLGVLAGLVMLAWPGLSMVALAQVAGIFLIVFGVLQVIRAFQLRGGARSLAESLSGE
jgi:uncharacterized membrane protein HdeD (DUF308 family)